jgi:fluoroquinolone resistance protein
VTQKNVDEQVLDRDFTIGRLESDVYEQIEFVNCVFSNLRGVSFIDCVFRNCNLSNATVAGARFSDVLFIECKLTGVNFSEAGGFGFCIQAERCILDYVLFEKIKLGKSQFSGCKMHRTDFTHADASKCRFQDCDFDGAIFSGANLSTVDFTTSRNFVIDPTLNNLKKAKFLSADLAGLLTRFEIIVR